MNFGGTLQELLQDVLRFIPNLIAALVTFTASPLFSGLAAQWVRRAAQVKVRDLELLRLLSRLTRWRCSSWGPWLLLVL